MHFKDSKSTLFGRFWSEKVQMHKTKRNKKRKNTHIYIHIIYIIIYLYYVKIHPNLWRSDMAQLDSKLKLSDLFAVYLNPSASVNASDGSGCARASANCSVVPDRGWRKEIGWDWTCVPRSKLPMLGMVIPPLIGILIMGIQTPTIALMIIYLLYRHNGSL